MLPASFTPDFLSQLELLRLRSRRAFLGSRQGGHPSPKRGHGIEFSDYRKYEQGDNPRHIDWGVYARTDRLYVKRFQEEQDLHVLIILDTSASMATPAHEHKWEKARDLALALAYVALMEQDSVMLSALGSFHSPAFYGGRAIHTLGKLLCQIQPGKSKDLGQEMRRAASRIRFPGIAIVISDFLMPFAVIEEAFLTLRAKNLDISAVQILGPDDINPLPETASALAVDSETGEVMELALDETQRSEYGVLLVEHNQRLKNFLADGRIAYSLALSSKSLAEIIQESIAETGLIE